jgi:hypothetical protein
MNIKTAAAAPLTWGRHCLGIMRSLSPATVIAVTLALVVGGAGFADAATGGTFILGKANHETATASLSDSKGTPLSLSAPAGVAPLAVNGNALVANLNANYLGGLSATGIQPTGGDGFTAINNVTSFSNTPTVIATTGALPAGTYYVTATTQLTSSFTEYCYVATGSNPDVKLAFTNSNGSPDFPAAMTVAASVTAGDTLQELCYVPVTGQSGSAGYSGITAIRILSSSTGTTPATTGAQATHPQTDTTRQVARG